MKRNSPCEETSFVRVKCIFLTSALVLAALCLITPYHKCKSCFVSRGATRGAGGTILRAPNDCGGRRKVPTMSQVLSSVLYICFRKISVSNMGGGRQTCLLPRAPSNLVTPLFIGPYVIKVSLIFFKGSLLSTLIRKKLSCVAWITLKFC